MNIEQANTITMTRIFECMHIQPVSGDDHEACYPSPLSKEEGEMIIVNKASNTWHYPAEQLERSPIDFACRLLAFKQEDHTVFDGRRWLANMVAQPPVLYNTEEMKKPETISWYIVRKEPLDNRSLERYLEQRGIDAAIAKPRLEEVYVRHRGKSNGIYTLGFQNDDDGYELLNPFFKERIAPHALTFIRGKGKTKIKTLHIFKDFMDYLTAVTIHPEKILPCDSIVLNSYSHIKQATGYIRNFSYRHVYTWLTNDLPGYRATFELADFFKTENSVQHAVRNPKYYPHKSLNAWHMYHLNLTLEARHEQD